MNKRITIELNDVEAAALDMVKYDALLRDPAGDYTDESLVKSFVTAVLEDDLATHDHSMAH